jgi:hypothetical protein
MVLAATAFAARPARAHCDSMDGPVVQAARAALASSNVNLALVWVKRDNEQSIRDLFAKTLQVRKLGPAAQEMADMYFFETLVRVHRAGEGEAYTGLKPAGYYKGVYEAADRALRKDDLTDLNMLPVALSHKLEQLHKAAVAASKYPQGDVQAGREFVEKYTLYMHYIETLDKLVHEEAGEHATF